MAKPKTIFRCAKCDAQFPKWEGRCRECGGWGTLEEETRSVFVNAPKMNGGSGVVSLREVAAAEEQKRLSTGFAEFDRVLSGGLVPGSLTLLGGDPGVGKSTLLLHVARAVSENNQKALYVSGEESAAQVSGRLKRLGEIPENFQFLGEATLDAIIAAAADVRPSLLIVDSLQTVRVQATGVLAKQSELKAATEALMNLAKQSGIPILLIGHVTKGGQVAGPKTIEHLVDTVLYFEKTDASTYRILRAVKHRFGGVTEIGVWEMTNDGLKEVPNPSGAFLTDRRNQAAGSSIAAILEGSRVFLVEIQALVSKTRFGYPQRRAAGFDLNRLQLMIAVLKQHAAINLAFSDVHLNVVGGIKVNDPACDLSVALAIASAYKNIPVDPELIAIGELGLQGEVRGTADLPRRLEEAARLGFKRALIPKRDVQGLPKGIEILQADSLPEALTIGLSR